MWNRYKVELCFVDKVMGGIPKHPDIIRSWLEARAPSEAAYARLDNPTPLAELAVAVAEEVNAEAVAENKVWSGFKGDSTGLYVDGYHLKSHLKDAANTLQKYQKVTGLKAKLANRVFVQEPKLYLGATEPAGYWEHPVHIMTMQGPRSALKRNDYVEKAKLSATLLVLDDQVITEHLLWDLLSFGSVRGFGAERGLGHGRYEFTFVAIE